MTISHPAPPQICDLARFSSRRSPAKTQQPIQQLQKSIRVISRALPILVSLLAPTRTSDVSISVCLVVWCRVLSFLILIVLWVSPCKADLPFRRWHLPFGFTFLHTAYRVHHHCTYTSLFILLLYGLPVCLFCPGLDFPANPSLT